MLGVPQQAQVMVQSIPDPRLPIEVYLSECKRLGLKPSEAFFHYFNQHRMAYGGFKFFMQQGGKDMIGYLATPEGVEWLGKEENLKDFFEYLMKVSR